MARSPRTREDLDRRHSNPHTGEEDLVKKGLVLLATLVVMVFATGVPAFAQEATAPSEKVEIIRWSIITAGFALGFAAAFGALAQARGLAAAAEGIARNPSASNEIRGALILGLVLIESLVIYVLLISLILFFLKPFGG
jgi:F-type H+-transporting ATPase subunit c